MPRKEPLYFKKSKAAEQPEQDYDYYKESESFQKKFEKDHSKVKSQKTKHQYDYEKSYNHPNYYEIRTEKYVSDYLYNDDDNTKYVGYVSVSNSEPYESEKVLEGNYHKHNKDNKKKMSGQMVIDYQSKIKGSNNIWKQKNPQPSYDENRIIREKNDFNIYISQRPITLRYESRESLKEESRKPRSNDQKRSKPQGNYNKNMTNLKNTPSDKVFHQQQQGYSQHVYSTMNDPYDTTLQKSFNELTPNISQILAQSVLRLIYLPLIVTSSNNIPQAGSIEPGLLVNSANKQTYDTDVFDDSQNVMSVFTAHNTDKGSIFKTASKESKLPKIQRSQESIYEEEMKAYKRKNQIEKKLCESTLGTAMTVESYANLIVSHIQPNPTSGDKLTSLLKAAKTLKQKKGKKENIHETPNKKVKQSQVKNEFQEISDQLSKPEKPDKGFEGEFISGYQSNESLITNQENTKKKIERKSRSKKNKSPEVNNKKRSSREEKKFTQMRGEDLQQKEEANNNINEDKNSSTCKNSKTTLENKQKEIKPKNIGTETQCITSKTHLTEIKGAEYKSIKDSSQVTGGDSTNSLWDHGVKNKKSISNPKNYSVISEDPMIIGNYKKVGNNQKSIHLQGNVAIPEERKDLAKGEASNISKKISLPKKNYSSNKTYSANFFNNNEIIDIPQDKGFSREISSNDFEGTSGVNNQTREEKEAENSYSLTKKESYTSREEFHKREMNQYIIGRDENLNATKSSLNCEQVRTQQLKSPNSILHGKSQEEHRASSKSIHEQNVKINNKLQPNKCDRLSKETLVGKPAVDVIHPPPKRSFAAKSTSNILLKKNEDMEEFLDEHPTNLLQYTEAISIISFQTARYILGVSCFDKLINVADFIYYEDD